jgi:hypothetical protein
MADKKPTTKKKQKEKPADKAPATPVGKNPTTPPPIPASIESEKAAKDWAKQHIPKDKTHEEQEIDGEKVKVPLYDVAFVTADRNVFWKSNEGAARNHAAKQGIKVFEVKL